VISSLKRAVWVSLLLATSLGCTRKNDTEILIGHLGAMTGSEATFGINTQKGIQMAVDEWNAKGGIKGKKIAVKSLDNQGKPEEAAATAARLGPGFAAPAASPGHYRSNGHKSKPKRKAY
jgi:ABC-type branched-subunit amino acid transport system substrate-binding protein